VIVCVCVAGVSVEWFTTSENETINPDCAALECVTFTSVVVKCWWLKDILELYK